MNQNIKNYVKPLIPILKAEQVESTYALRMTPLDKYTKDDLISFLKTFEDYVFTHEVSKKQKEHYHAVIFTKMYEDDVRLKIREFLSKHFIEPPKRGDANKQYNLSEVIDLELSLIYILKDGGAYYTSDNVDRNYLEELKKKSYRKFSKDDFKVELENLKKKFKDDVSSLGDMMTAVVKLKALYRQPINMVYIYQLCVSFDIHNKPDVAEDYVREFLSRYR